MPVVSAPMVCESTTANVTAALRESLGSGSNGSCSSAAAATASTGNSADEAVANGLPSAALMPNGIASNAADADDTNDCLQNKVVASTKRVLFSKVDYEEVNGYGHSVLDTFKAKYVVLKPNAIVTAAVANGSNGNTSTTTITENGRASPATCNNNNNSIKGNNGVNVPNGVGGGNNNSSSSTSTADCNGNAATPSAGSTSNRVSTVNAVANMPTASAAVSPLRRPNAHELPQPKRVLFPRESVRVGWKNGVRKWQIGVGMMNVGNTCYLNSTLQAVFHVPSMANWLASETQHMEHCDGGGNDGCIICAMWKTLLMAQTQTSPIRPYFVYSKLRSICKHLVMGRQEDAHEFLRYLVEAMEKSYLSRFRNLKELDQYSKETTPMNQILGGYLKSAVRCLACNHVSVTFQHFQDLLLDIRKADTVEEALDGYFSRERLEDMGYKCESCKKKVSATKQFTLERAPIALCIQLKRFSMMGSKLNKPIAIRPRLDLSKYLTRKNPNEQHTYKLVSMITHLGASQHCGHYTAIGLTESGAYYNFDDSCVRPISVQGVCNTNAYIIFYEMESPPQSTPRVPPANTQTSGTYLKDNSSSYQAKTNGFALSAKNNNSNHIDGSETQQTHRLIGPQLPPGGLHNGGGGGGIKLKNVIPNCNSNSSQSTYSNSGNAKIMIHFKNGHATIRSSATSTSASATSTTASPSAASTTGSLFNGNTASNMQNGLHSHSGGNKTQESSYSSAAPVGALHKSNCMALVKVENGSEGSCSPEPEDGVSSTTDGYSECTTYEVISSTLPSMPELFDDAATPNQRSTPQPHTATGSSCTNSKPSPHKSLVPYDLESDDDNAWALNVKRTENPSAMLEHAEKLTDSSVNKTLKRGNSCSLSENNNNAAEENDHSKLRKTPNGHANGSVNTNATNGGAGHLASPQQSKTKQKTIAVNPIDNIFNSLTKSSTANGGGGVSINKNCTLNGNKLLKHKSESPQHLLLSPSSPLSICYDSGSDDKYEPSTTPPHAPFKRARSTPPSPPSIQTSIGTWKVSNINMDSKAEIIDATKKSRDVALASSPLVASSSATTPTKNWINPFSSNKSQEVTHEKPAARQSEKRSQFIGNGYQTGGASNNSSSYSASCGAVVAELQQQSHRGYGAPVLTWNGEQNDIDRELKIEARKQRQNELDDEEDNEMDRGRQKKLKQAATNKEASYERTPGYNPFQEQDNQRRWKTGGSSNSNSGSNSSGNPYRYYSANYRQQPYQRNKYKFQRYNFNKYQRPQQQHQQSTQRHNGDAMNSNSLTNSSGYDGRRES